MNILSKNVTILPTTSAINVANEGDTGLNQFQGTKNANNKANIPETTKCLFFARYPIYDISKKDNAKKTSIANPSNHQTTVKIREYAPVAGLLIRY